MKRNHFFLVTILAAILVYAPSRVIALDLFYKEASLGPFCTFTVPRIWKAEDVGWSIPEQVKNILLQVEAVRYIGKEVVMDMTYMKSKQPASINGAVSQVVAQLTAAPDVQEFRHTCSPFPIENAFAKVCTFSYQRAGSQRYMRALFVISTRDGNSAYSFLGGYIKEYNRTVVDKVFTSMRFR